MANIIKNLIEIFAVKKELKGELSSSRKDYWGLKNMPVYNPDSLVGRKGLGVYDEMLEKDAKIKNCYYLKRLCRLSTGWSITSAVKENNDAEEQAEFIRWNFDNMDGNINDFLLKIWDAMRQGYKVAEKLYEMVNDGEWKGKIRLRKIKVKDSKNYSFDFDEYGNIKPDGLLEGAAYSGTKAVQLPVEKFIIYSYDGLDDSAESYYGISDFRNIYRYYFSNDLLIKFRDYCLERFGKPPIIGKKTGNITGKTDKELLDLLTNIHTKGATIVPKELEIDLPDTIKGLHTYFERAMEYNNKMISQGMLIGSLMQDSGERGSYALGKKHFEIFVWVLDQIGEQTRDIIMGEQIIKPLIDMNFPKPIYPKFKMPSLVSEDSENKANILKILIEAGVVDSEESWVRDYVSVPHLTKEEADRLKEEKEERTRKAREQELEKESIKKEVRAELEEEMKKKGEGYAEDAHSPWQVQTIIFNKDRFKTHEQVMEWLSNNKFKLTKPLDETDESWRARQRPPEQYEQGTLRTKKITDGVSIVIGKLLEQYRFAERALTKYEKKVNFAEIELKWDELLNEAIVTTRDEFQKIIDDVIGQIKRKKIISDKDYEGIMKIVANVGGLQSVIYKMLIKTFLEGKKHGMGEINRGMAETEGFKDDPKRKLKKPPETELPPLVGAVLGIDITGYESIPFTQEELDKIAKSYKAKAFIMAGDEKARIQKGIWTILQDAIDNNWAEDRLKEELAGFFKNYTAEEMRSKTVGIVRDYRTSMNGAYNAGRWDLFQDSNDVDGLMYSAILDERTSEFCEKWDDFTAKKTDPIWLRITPPNHWNCRSIIVPIMIEEKYIRSYNRGIEPAKDFDRLPGGAQTI